MPKGFDSTFNSGEAREHSLPLYDLSFQNERAMWWAEFDSVGEEAVRDYVERNAYTPTGMEVARQWLARREFLQLRGDVQSVRALAEQAQETASESLRSASEALTLAKLVDANSRAIVEIAASAKKTVRIMVLIGIGAALFVLAAIVMVLASSWYLGPSSKQRSALAPRPKLAVLQPRPLAAPRSEAQQTSAISPDNAQKTPSPNAPQINSSDLKPEGQSLAGVLALIADKVSGEGTISFMAQVHDTANGLDNTEQLSYTASNVTIDPNRCRVGYHWHVAQNGRVVSDQDPMIEFRLAKNISVGSIDAESGRGVSMSAYPKVYMVHIARWDSSSGNDLYFHDRNAAARVGAAIRHAVKLCDRGETNAAPVAKE